MAMKKNKRSATVAPEDRVPVVQKICYGAGVSVSGFMNALPVNMFMPVFNIALGINPALLGIVLMVYRAWDAVTDAVMGNLSDNVRTPWGRRRPFIVVGAVLAGIMMPLFWQVSPHWSQPVMIAYIVVMGLLLYTCTTIWGMPYYSLGMELTPDYNERTRIMAVRSVFEKLMAIFSGWMLALASLEIFADPATGEPDLANGVRHISWLAGLIVIVLGMLPGLFVKERYYTKEASKQAKISLFKSLKMTLSNRPFLYLMVAYLLNFVGLLMTVSLGQYLCIYYVCGGDLQQAGIIQGLRGTLMFGAGILGIPLWAWVSQKIGKKHTLGVIILMGYARSALTQICYTPEHPYLMILPDLFMAAFGSALWMLVPSMVADIADYDELHTGERREGSYSSVSSWLLKLAGTLTVGLSGLILVKTGFDVTEYGNSQPPAVLQRMMNVHIFLPAVFWTVALVCLLRYSLTHQMMLDIRQKLETRRGKV